MQPSTQRRLGRVDLDVTAFALGPAPVGNFLAEIDEGTSDAMFQHATWQGFASTTPRRSMGMACPNEAPASRCTGSRGIPAVRAGARTVGRHAKTLDGFSHPIRVDFRAELKHRGLLRQDARVPA